MKVLLDTHIWLWWITNPDRLGPTSRRAIEDAGNAVFFSAASSWEISIKYALGKLSLPTPPLEFVPKRLQRDNISPLAVTHIHALTVSTLPHHHRDPFDRVLVAQAQAEQCALCTVDPHIKRYDVSVLDGYT